MLRELKIDAFTFGFPKKSETDRLAGKYQDELGAYSPITHMYPSSPTVLEINGMTITSNIQHQLIKAYSEPKYIRYLQ